MRFIECPVEIAMRHDENGMISYQPLLNSQRALVQQRDALTESHWLVGVDSSPFTGRFVAAGKHASLPVRRSPKPSPLRLAPQCLHIRIA